MASFTGFAKVETPAFHHGKPAAPGRRYSAITIDEKPGTKFRNKNGILIKRDDAEAIVKRLEAEAKERQIRKPKSVPQKIAEQNQPETRESLVG